MSLPNATTPATSTSQFSVNPNSVQPGNSQEFVDRRSPSGEAGGRVERRQFGSSHAGLSDNGRELALAIDQYKSLHHRRYLTCDEMLSVLADLGYEKRS